MSLWKKNKLIFSGFFICVLLALAANFVVDNSKERSVSSLTNDKMDYLDRYKGAIMGVYLGDALGKGPETVYTENPETAPLAYRERKIVNFEARMNSKYYQGRDRNQPAGTYTDDTEETLALLHSLIISEGKLDNDVMAYQLYKFFHPVHGYSRSTQKLLGSFALNAAGTVNGIAQRNHFFTERPDKAIRDSNGCAMRIAPLALALVHEKDDGVFRDKVYKACAITHPAPASMEGAAVIAKAIQYALKSTVETFNPEEFIDILITFAKQATIESFSIDFDTILAPNYREQFEYLQDYETVIKNDLSELVANLESVKANYNRSMTIVEEVAYIRKEDNTGVKYYTRTSVPAAVFYVLKYYQDFQQVFAGSTHAALAGDADTLPAMAGSIVGALYGLSHVDAFPGIWMEQLYTGTEEWKRRVGYDETVHEELTREEKVPGFKERYVSYKKVLSDVEKLYQIVNP